MKKVVKIPIYFGDLVLIQKSCFKSVSKKYKLQDLPAFDAVVFSSPKKNGYTRYYMLVGDNVTPKIISHEVVHIVNSVFRDRDIKLDIENDEPQAYLTGWITEQCYKHFNINYE